MSATTPWGLIRKVGRLYEKYRQIKVDGRYLVFRQKGPPDSSRNWVHFKRAADIIHENRIDPEEYIAAQFVGATPAAYPYPTNLYSKRAYKNWKAVNLMPKLQDSWEHNNMYLGILMKRFGQTASDVVMNPYYVWFTPWFRAVFLEEDQLCFYADEILKSLESGSVRQFLESIGEDVAGLERKLHRIRKEVKFE